MVGERLIWVGGWGNILSRRKLIWYRSPSVRSASASPRWARAVLGWWCPRPIIAGSRMTEGHLPQLIAGEIFDLRGGTYEANWSKACRFGWKLADPKEAEKGGEQWESPMSSQFEGPILSKIVSCVSGSFGAAISIEIAEIPEKAMLCWPRIFDFNWLRGTYPRATNLLFESVFEFDKPN